MFFILGTTNSLFQVEFDSNGRSALCRFKELYFSANKSCSIVYTPYESGDCYSSLKNETRISSNLTNLDSALIPLSITGQHPMYCFIARGVIMMMTIAIEGTFKLSK